MTYLKTLIALTGLALLTACAGGVTINATTLPPAETCTANPFIMGCNATQTQQEEFCRDRTRTPDTKTKDCALTVIRVCEGDIFDRLCTTPTEPQAEAFCSDASKTTATKANDCTSTVSRVCGENPFEAGLCFADNTYAIERLQIRETCTSKDENVRNDLCPTIVDPLCMENPFLDECRVGRKGVTGGEYDMARMVQIMAICDGADGTGFGNVFHRACNDINKYETERTRILNACASGTENNPNCPPETLAQVCNANPYNMGLCDDTDYNDKRAEELAECRKDNGRPSCVDAAATTCMDNPFQAVLCFIDTTYDDTRTDQTRDCFNRVADAPNCDLATAAFCDDTPFDGFCKGVPAYVDIHLNQCAEATATKFQCNTVFDDALAECLEDPFSVACDTEATFMDSKVSVRTKRFGFCAMIVNTGNARCRGYATCNTSTAFAPLTCGADFNPVRVTFCGVTDNAFDAGCVGNFADTTAQLAFCKVTVQAFDARCVGNLADTSAQMAFCAVPARAFDAGCVGNLIDAMAQTEYCKVPARAFDAGCVGNLADAAAQLEFCKLPTSDPFGTNCGGTAFRAAREEFCIAKPTTLACDTDLHGEDLEYDANLCGNGACVETADWLDSFTADGGTAPPTTPAATDPPRHGFLQGGVATVDFGTLTDAFSDDPTVITLNLRDATYNSLPLGGDVEDGMAFFETFIANKSGGYAGIFSGTNLGLPLTAYVAGTEPIVVWYGKFGVEGSADILDRDFTLNVNFQTRKIDAFVQFGGTSHYKLDGDFNDKGVIVNGTVIYGAFTNSNPDTIAEITKAGILTGLIGSEGAVGIFHADLTTSGSDTYVGGFVAAPYILPADDFPSKITFSDWVRSFVSPLGPSPNTGFRFRANQFLQGTETTLLTTGTQDSGSNTAAPEVTTITLADNDLGGEAADGFAFFDGHIAAANKRYYYTGILSGTDLGAPLTGQPTSTLWRGYIRLTGFGGLNKHFDLTVNFGAGSQMGGGTLSAFVPFGSANTTLNYKIDAEFNADGLIITGDATNPNIVYDEFTDGNPDMPEGSVDKHTGILSGIIGEQGVVAVFISNPHSEPSYVFSGGLVAAPIQGTSGLLKWANSLATFPRFVPTTENQFLQGTATGLHTKGTRASQLNNAAPTVTTVTLADKGLGGEAADGFAFFDGYSGQQHYYAGILSGTDLGAPLTEQPTNTVWRGHIALDGFATVNKSFDLTVNFGAGSQTGGGTLSAFVKAFNNNDVSHYKIDAEFNADGVIVPAADSIVYDEFTGGDPNSPTMASLRHTGMVTGLIGEQGAVGVFIGRTTSRNMSGGFVARPTPSTP